MRAGPGLMLLLMGKSYCSPCWLACLLARPTLCATLQPSSFQVRRLLLLLILLILPHTCIPPFKLCFSCSTCVLFNSFPLVFVTSAYPALLMLHGLILLHRDKCIHTCHLCALAVDCAMQSHQHQLRLGAAHSVLMGARMYDNLVTAVHPLCRLPEDGC